MAAEASARPFYLPSAHLHLAITIFNLSQQTCCGANTEMWWHAERGSGCSEDVMQRALDCPCVSELREGPCGASFERAFRCYLRSEHPEKGSDCHPAFAEYHRCLRTDHSSQTKTQASGGLAMIFGRLLQRARR